VGEHAVHFGNLGETVTLAHSAHTRDTFASGALRAAAWVVGQKPGLYSMADVMGL
jgi:4-hydroxy-tetrahydrodipicolinate reductase